MRCMYTVRDANPGFLEGASSCRWEHVQLNMIGLQNRIGCFARMQQYEVLATLEMYQCAHISK